MSVPSFLMQNNVAVFKLAMLSCDIGLLSAFCTQFFHGMFTLSPCAHTFTGSINTAEENRTAQPVLTQQKIPRCMFACVCVFGCKKDKNLELISKCFGLLSTRRRCIVTSMKNPIFLLGGLLD